MSNKGTQAEKFVILFNYWCALKLKRTYPIKNDLRYKCHACAEYEDVGNKTLITLVYNSRRLAQWSDAMVVCGVFHEIGHLIHNLPYNTKEEKIKAEYEAELYALRQVRKHYPKYLPEVLKASRKVINSRRYKREFPIHHKAFLKIKDYRIKNGKKL